MKTQELSRVPAVGTQAPDFRLTSAKRAEVALADYREKRHVILWFSKGLFCPFCRRHGAVAPRVCRGPEARQRDSPGDP